MKGISYCQLMRLHRPVGILLLWWPTAWALWIANAGNPPLSLISLFLLGTILMRSAGCVVNDIADRHIDGHVKRTQLRPLPAGEISLVEALALLLLLVFCAFLVLIQLPIVCFYYALAAIFITILYPFCKRFIEGPQFVLGIAFSMSIPMVFAASGTEFDVRVLYLLAINFLWVLAYDTQYAMVDRDDDLHIGVKSTAILFAEKDKSIIGFFQIALHALWLLLGFTLNLSFLFYSCWIAASLILIYQQKLIANRDRNGCFRAFTSNAWYGLLMWLGISGQWFNA